MKRVIPCLLLLPLLTSCVQEGYYEPGYYPPPPPPPYVEVHRYDAQRHAHRPAPRARVYQGHSNNQGNVQVHGNPHRGGQAVVVNPRQPQQQAPAQAQVPPSAHGPAVKAPAHGIDQQNNVSSHN